MNSQERKKLKSVIFSFNDIIKNEGVYRFVSKQNPNNCSFSYYFFTFQHDGRLISFYIDLSIQVDLTFLRDDTRYYSYKPYAAQMTFSKQHLTHYYSGTQELLGIILNYLKNHPQVTLNE